MRVDEGVSGCEWKSDWVCQCWSEGWVGEGVSVNVNKRGIGWVSAGVTVDGWVRE